LDAVKRATFVATVLQALQPEELVPELAIAVVKPATSLATAHKVDQVATIKEDAVVVVVVVAAAAMIKAAVEVAEVNATSAVVQDTLLATACNQLDPEVMAEVVIKAVVVVAEEVIRTTWAEAAAAAAAAAVVVLHSASLAVALAI